MINQFAMYILPFCSVRVHPVVWPFFYLFNYDSRFCIKWKVIAIHITLKLKFRVITSNYFLLLINLLITFQTN